MTPLLITRQVAPFQPDLSVIDTKALDLGGNERLKNLTEQTFGIANEWSIQMLLSPDSDSLIFVLLEIKQQSPTLNSGMIQVAMLGNAANDPFQIILRRTSGTSIVKKYSWDNTYSAGVKVNYLFTWDGTDLLLYIDGVETAPTVKNTDNAFTFDDITRTVGVGGFAAQGDTSFAFRGQIHSTSIWNTALGQAAVTSLENSGSPEDIDNQFNVGNYSGAGNLVHYWRHGFDAGDLGKDYGSSPIDIMEDADNISDADIVDY